uniref:Uncharacterized protein LOC113799072 n=1 Tax=Dermatophagoides pteronyssinus TaxID=6956 RepID=A0A6P6YKN6_DERPT
ARPGSLRTRRARTAARTPARRPAQTVCSSRRASKSKPRRFGVRRQSCRAQRS